MAGRILVIVFLIFTILETNHAMTTTKRPNLNEFDNYGFYYDPESHMLALSNYHQHTRTCYVMKLSTTESKMVHTHDGMTRLQLKMLTHISSATMTMTVDQLTTASTRLGHYCTSATSIYSMTV